MRTIHGVLAVIVGLALAGCKDLTGSQPLPAGTSDPSSYNTRDGALGMRVAALYTLEQGLRSYIINAGLLTDELESNLSGASPGTILQESGGPNGLVDQRVLPEPQFGGHGAGTVDEAYDSLQSVRGHISQALGALAAYDTAKTDTATVKILRGELYALDGYAEILLADFYCSGVPLSTLDFQQDFTYHASSTTDQVDIDAIAKEDSALALADTSTQVLNLARVLKGRALLNRGLYQQAVQAVAQVPDGFQYQLAIQLSGPSAGTCSGSTNCLNAVGTVSDREGSSGLAYLSGSDPRTLVDTVVEPNPSAGQPFIPLTLPVKYSSTGFSPFVVADWIEARLIQAEGALQGHDPSAWLTLLNHLRDTAIVPGQTATLSDTADPGPSPNDSARVSLTFHERAFWLFLTGHRQGDLRRLIRQYGRRQDQTYPSGPYLAPGTGTGTYGTDVTAPIPGDEYANPLFHGCIDRNA